MPASPPEKPTGQRQPRIAAFTVLAAALVFYLAVAWAVPWCVTDDLQWGMEQGFRWWRYGLLNGRYVGNFFALVMCSFPLVKVLVMGFGMFAIPFLMAALMCRGKREIFLPLFMVFNGAVMFMPGAMWTEVYGWISGFGNYGLSVGVFLAFLLVVRRTHEKRDRLKFRAAVLFSLSAVMGLFVENESVLFVGVALVLGVYACIWDRTLCLPFWAAFAGAVLGAALMFSNGVMRELSQTGTAVNDLRKLSFSLAGGPVQAVKDILKQFLFCRIPATFGCGGHFAVLLGVIIAVGFWNSRARVLALLSVIPIALWYYLKNTELYSDRGNCCAVCLCWMLAFLALVVQQAEGTLKIRRLLLFLAAPLSLAPMAATLTQGERFNFLPLVIVIMVAEDLVSPLFSTRSGVWAAGAVLAVTVGIWGVRSATVGGCNLLREELIRQAVEAGDKEILQPADSYQGRVWFARTAWDAEYAVYYRRFYGIPDDVTLIFLPKGTYETWPDIAEDQWASRTEFPPYEGEFKSSLP